MAEGARSTEQWREHRALLEAISRERNGGVLPGEPPAAPPPAPPPPASSYVAPHFEPDELPRRWGEIALGVALLIIGALWIAAIATSLETTASPLRDLAGIVSMASGPLALLGILFLLIQRTSRREARRFGQTAAAMRAEAAGLEHVIGRLSTRIEDNRDALAEHARQLLLLGEDSALRLAEISAGMRNETNLLGQHAELFERAAASARADLNAMQSEMPRIEQQVRDIAERMKDVGLDTQERAAGLETQLIALGRRGRETDDIAGGAAERLAAQLTRIEGSSNTAVARMDDAAASMGNAVDAALTSAADAVDQTRIGLDTQRAALIAMVEQSAAAFDRAGTEATQSMARRLDEIAGKIDAISTRLKAQDAASQALLGGIDKGLADVEARFADLGATGTAETERFGGSIATLRTLADGIGDIFTNSGAAADTLFGRAGAIKAALDASAADLDGALPAALARIEEHARAGRTAIAALTPEAERLAASVRATSGGLASAGDVIARQRAALDDMGRLAEQRLDEIRAHAETLEATIGQTSESARLLSESAGPQLVEALLRVRETAVQAAERAREALAAVIPEAAGALGEASRAAMKEALGDQIEQQMASIAITSERAVKAAHQATERLMRQMLTIADTTSAVEKRIAEAREDAIRAEEDSFPRRVALLIESLNSTAIDVTKILSNDVTDAAWAAYLKGDRGIFTRRAVRLLDTNEARDIARHYEEEPEFREQVNRYIHDFESMLRRVLSSRDGSPLSVTLLSSDMGKLYVALAQAIERLRS